MTPVVLDPGSLVIITRALEAYRRQQARDGIMGGPVEQLARHFRQQAAAQLGVEPSFLDPAPLASPGLLTAQQAADRLQVSVRTLQRQVRAGHVAVVRVGRCVRYRLSDLDNPGHAT